MLLCVVLYVFVSFFILESPTKKPVKSKEFISSSSDDDEGLSAGKLSLADSLTFNNLCFNWCK